MDNETVFIVQRGESQSGTSSLLAPNALKFVAVYDKQEEALIYARTMLDQIHGQLLANGFHHVMEKEISGDITIGLVNKKMETTIAFYVVQKLRVQ